MRAYVARDLNGDLVVFFNKPKKGVKWWYCYGSINRSITEQDLPEGINPQWSDDEPIEVELKLERAKQ